MRSNRSKVDDVCSFDFAHRLRPVSQQSRARTTDTIQRDSRTLGATLRKVKGEWSAGGHQFNDDMVCRCGVTFLSHQERHTRCRNPRQRRVAYSGGSDKTLLSL